MTSTGAGVRDVLFTFTFETWSDAVARGMARPPDRLALTLLEHPQVRRLLIADPPRSAPRRIAKRLLRRHDAPFPGSADHARVQPVTWHRVDPVDVSGLSRQGRDYDRALASAARERGMSDVAVITASPFAAGYSPFDWATGTTYYARDDWTELPSRQAWWPALRESYARLRRSGRPVVAVSQAILDRIEPTGEAVVVPNGVEPAEWLGPQPADPSFLAGIPHPRALYVGTLDSRLDVPGVLELARCRPDLHVVLLGVVGDAAAIAPLQGVANIHVLPPTDRRGLVAAVRNADLCLVAHARTALTEAMSPLKIYEYLAGGAPVLSIDLPPVRGIDPRVLLTDTTAQFADRLDEALALGRTREDARLRFVAENSWRSRHERILDVAFRAGAVRAPA
jgi:teichuronic acid biosynthesis glycosyltransferase TuaH